jgi:hypothetical protein
VTAAAANKYVGRKIRAIVPRDGTGDPRSASIARPRGPIDAAIVTARAMFRGELGRIIAVRRMIGVIHDG